jgi:hypothetical protein
VNFATSVKNAAVDVIALSGNNTANPIGPDRNQLGQQHLAKLESQREPDPG